MLKTQDVVVADAIANELKRQRDGLEMIPSENYASKEVLEALGSCMTNKYSEGYPGKRYYGGNEFVDVVERLAIERAKKLFGAEHANVQPYSGSPANMEIYFALLNFGDKVMGLNLAHGGHLTHGHPVNFSGKSYKFVQYGVDKQTEQLDYEAIRELAIKEKPKLIISGYTAYPRTIDFKKFSEIAEEVGAISMVDMSHISGLIAGGVHPSPFPFTDVVMTTTHKTLRGPRGAIILCKEKFAQQIDKAVFPGMQGGPHDNNTAAKAVALAEAMKPEFKLYAQQIVKNSKTLAKELQKFGFRLVSGGTDNHLILVDLQNKKVTGKEAEAALDKARITVNKNMVPFDPKSPFDPSGIRLGTPAITTRGMREDEMRQIGSFMNDAITNFEDEAKLKTIAEEVTKLTKSFPLYQ